MAPLPNPDSAIDFPSADVGALSPWLAYFQNNRTHLLPIPWNSPERLNSEERDLITRSIQNFQLGESSEGTHLMKTAREYAAQVQDLTYIHTLKLFIGEEQRHARDLERFMTQEGIPLARHHWSDMLFRKLRRLANLELAMVVLLTAELVATIYYKALRDATRSPILYHLCQQILHDERQHVRFQSQTLTLLRRQRPTWLLTGLQTLHQIFFATTLVIVWLDHSLVFRASGYSFRQFYTEVWQALQLAIANRPIPPDAAMPKSGVEAG